MKKIRSLSNLLAVAVVAITMAFIGATPAHAQPTEVWVDDDYCDICSNDGHTWNYDAFATIQDGIDAVASPGQVQVAAGYYPESITLKNGLELLGAGADLTTIDGNHNDSPIVALAHNSTFRGFTVTGGSLICNIAFYRCSVVTGSIYSSANNVEMDHNIIEDVCAALCARGSGLHFHHNLVQNNRYGISLSSSSPALIENNVIVNNDLGFELRSGFSGTVVNNTIADNRNGIMVDGSSPDINNNIVTGSTSWYGIQNAMHLGSPSLSNNNVWDNPNNYIYLSPGPGDISADPMFVDPGSGDYHLQASSPCIDAGTNEGAPDHDYDNDPRPFDVREVDNNGALPEFDMGADEYVPPCEPVPRTQGYWHRQCLGAGLITPGRNGRGPQEVLEPEFLKTLVPAVDSHLQATIFLPPTFDTCEDGIDAEPPSDPCERALKQYTALLLNITSGRLQEGCDIDLSAEDCSAASIGDLVDELAGLINSGNPDDCKIAADCAGAVNENQGIIVPAASPIAPSGESSLFGVGLDIAISARTSDVPSAGTTADSPQQTPVADASPATPTSERVSATDDPEVLTADAPTAVDSSAPALVPYMPNVGSPLASQVGGEETIEDAATEVTDTHKTIERHLAVIANASAPARARRTSEDALLTALGGGYELVVRLQIIRALLGKVDVAYNILLAKHLEDIFLEAQEFGNKKVAQEAARLLKSLEPSRGSTE